MTYIVLKAPLNSNQPTEKASSYILLIILCKIEIKTSYNL